MNGSLVGFVLFPSSYGSLVLVFSSRVSLKSLDWGFDLIYFCFLMFYLGFVNISDRTKTGVRVLARVMEWSSLKSNRRCCRVD